MENELKALVGKRIRKCRRDKDITQADLARIIDGTSQQVNNWETGLRAVSVHYLRILAHEFGCTIGYLAGENEELLVTRGPEFTADNDLLAPVIQKGDRVEIDTTVTVPNDSGIFAIKREGGETFLRWLRPDTIGLGVTISVTNPAEWESSHVENINELQIVGKATAITRMI